MLLPVNIRHVLSYNV